MRAATLDSWGSEDVLNVQKDFAIPRITDKQVLVKVRACALSDYDASIRKGNFPELQLGLPFIPGFEIAGTIESVGVDVPKGLFTTGDQVVGLAPLNVGGGYADLMAIGFEFLRKKPPTMSFEEAAGAVLPGIRAYTALFYHMKVAAGETVLILNGASALGHMAVQLAGLWGVKIITTVASSEEFNYLQDIPTKIDRIINLSSEKLVATVLAETGLLGVNHILENPTAASVTIVNAPTKSELISCLGVHGTWVTSSPTLQLDPPESRLLHLRDARLSFLFEHSWTLSTAQQGKFLHMLEEILEKAAAGTLVPKVSKYYTLEKVRDAHRVLDLVKVGRVVLRL